MSAPLQPTTAQSAHLRLPDVRFSMEAPLVCDLVVAERGDPQMTVAVCYALGLGRNEQRDTDDQGDPTIRSRIKHGKRKIAWSDGSSFFAVSYSTTPDPAYLFSTNRKSWPCPSASRARSR